MLAVSWLFICLAGAYGVPIHQDKLEVTIEEGKIVGDYVRTSIVSYYAFLGIPYAKAPKGNLRFKAPVPIPKWNKTLKATSYKSSCIQSDGMTVIGSEDCLHINVYVPETNKTTLPVMVWVYGGSFTGGESSNETYPPNLLIKEDVIFVSFNYRLGIFGFLATGDSVAPGNYGIKDQVLALKWVKRNIAFFGGDVNKITIFGQSAGSASVSYLTVISKTQGLFQRAIMQSGSALCAWSLGRDIKGTVQTISKTLFVDDRTSKLMVDGLRKINAEELQRVSNTVYVAKVIVINPLVALIFAPVIEPESEEAVITQSGFESIKNGNFHTNITYMIGLNSQEGNSIRDTINSLRPLMVTFDFDKSKFIPIDLRPSNSDKDKVSKLITDYYFDGKPVILADTEFIQYSSDKMFNYPIYNVAKLIGTYSPVYFYLFSYEGVLGDDNRKVRGVAHSEETKYIFLNEKDTSSVNAKDNVTRHRMVKMWTDFAKYGNPTIESTELLQNVIWPTINCGEEKTTYLNIDEDLSLKNSMFEKAITFWDFIYMAYGKKPYITL